MEIDLRQVKAMTTRLLDHLIETEGVEKIELKSNFYWDMAPEIMFDVSEDPKEITVGSLYDEWEFLLGVLEEDGGTVTYMLTEISPLLRYIGEVYGGSFSGEVQLPDEKSE